MGEKFRSRDVRAFKLVLPLEKRYHDKNWLSGFSWEKATDGGAKKRGVYGIRFQQIQHSKQETEKIPDTHIPPKTLTVSPQKVTGAKRAQK